MIRKMLFVIAAAVALSFMAADSVWACKFLDNAGCRSRRSCGWTYLCCPPADCCLPKTCEPVGPGTINVEQGTLKISPAEKPMESPKVAEPQPPKETPVVPPVEKPTAPSMPTPLPDSNAPTERAVEPKPVVPPITESPIAEPPKEPAVPAEPPIAEPPKAEPPKAEPPKAEPPKAEPPKAEPPKEKAAEPETDAFGNVIAQPPKKVEEPAAEPKAAEPKAEEPKAAEPKAEEPKAAEPKAEEPKAEEPKAEPPKEPEKKQEEADPFTKNNVKQYRLWTDASGEFQVNARFVGFVDGKVRLQKTNGRYVRIEMNQLCTADQRFLRQIESLAQNR